MPDSYFSLEFVSNVEYQYDYDQNGDLFTDILYPQPNHPTDPTIGCRIVIGSYICDRWCSTRVWREEDYIRHWRESLRRIIFDGYESTALLISYRPFTKDRYEDTDWWTVVNCGDYCEFTLITHTQDGFYLAHNMDLTPENLCKIIQTDPCYRAIASKNSSKFPLRVPLEALVRFLKNL